MPPPRATRRKIEPPATLDNQSGQVKWALIVGAIGVFAVLYVFFQGQHTAITLQENHAKEMRESQTASDQALHAAEEKASYEYADQKVRAANFKTACDANANNFAALRVWLAQHAAALKPPPEHLVIAPCITVVEKKEE